MKTYLPIGSVVLLKEGTKKVMIYGRKQKSVDTGNEYDYLACLYPEGNISQQYQFLFNEENVDKVVFRGFCDAEDEAFVKNLMKIK